jgi:hypothetical protein
MGGITLMQKGFEGCAFGDCEYHFSLIYFLVILLISGIMISSTMAQESKTAWTWSVKTGDIEELKNKSYIPAFYMPNDTVNISWEIVPSNEVKEILGEELYVYPKGTDKTKYSPYVIPKDNHTKGRKYVKIEDKTSRLNLDNNPIYYVEINASAKTESKPINETHILEIRVEKPGSLQIQKKVPGWPNANLSGWKFTIEGPIDNNIPYDVRRSITRYTDEKGIVTITDLRPGNYTITEDQRSGWGSVLPKPKKVDPGSLAPLGPNEPLPFANIPNTLTFKKVDSEGNPLSGWTIVATGLDGQGTFSSPPTDSNGKTILIGLPSGVYNIDEKSQRGWKHINTSPNPATLQPGENINIEIKNGKTGTIKIIKKDSEGQLLPGWRFSISGPDPDLISPTVPTDSNGVIIIDNLLPGNYTITEIIPGGNWKTIPGKTVELPPGGEVAAQFVNVPYVPLTIIKYDDRNGNGKLDRDASGSPIESGLSGWYFTVEGPEGLKNAGPTNANGIAVANDLTPGNYVVKEQISADSKPGWICTVKNPQPVQISSRLPNAVEFGNKVNRIIIRKFNDTNINGKREKDEGGLEGWTFTVEGPNGMIAPPLPTNANGITVLEGLLPGTYNISEDLKGSWINTTPISRSITINAGEEKEENFGNINSSMVEIFKFNDTNRNGKLDPGENGSSGWVFTITGKATLPTNAEGLTVVEGLSAGEYLITENLKEGWLNTTPLTQSVRLGFGGRRQITFGNYYCLPCHRIREPKTPVKSDPDLIVIKDVSNISAEKMDPDNGYPVNYHIQICPSRGLPNMSAIPTDIVIAVDISPSISNLNESTISAVKRLVEGIRENDKQNVTRVGLVSWSDRENSTIVMPLTNNYNSVISRASEIKFAQGIETNYQEAVDTTLEAFQKANHMAGKAKKIVIITDASDNQTREPTSTFGPDYFVYAIVVGNSKDTKAYAMLDSMAREHRGYVKSIQNLSELEGVLVEMATAGSRISNVHLVETLPNYLILVNETAKDDKGIIRLNGDSKDWKTTTISWDIGELTNCWNTTFKAIFCWKLPADVNQPKLTSYINYTDENGNSRTIHMPEYQIHIVPTDSQKAQNEPAKTEGNNQPGSKALLAVLLAAIGLSAAVYFIRRRREG